MKRFSTKFFIIFTLLHMLGTVLLIDAGFAALRAEKQSMNTGQPEPSFVWLSVWSWIWQPVSELVQYYDQHHPHPVIETGDRRAAGKPVILFCSLCFHGRSLSGSASVFSSHAYREGDVRLPDKPEAKPNTFSAQPQERVKPEPPWP